MRRSSTDALPREDETIHYTGARLAELLAISVESTVVMPGSRTSTSIAAAAPQQLFHEGPASEHSSATGPIAFTLSQPIAVDAAAAPGAASRVGAAFSLAAIGIVFGLLVATSLAGGAHTPGPGSARRVEKRERVDAITPLVLVVRQKSAPKRRGRNAASVLRSAGGVAVAAPARPASEAPMGLEVLGQAQLDRPF